LSTIFANISIFVQIYSWET
jgi:hypothetical protein